jgi:hypothetical protein
MTNEQSKAKEDSRSRMGIGCFVVFISVFYIVGIFILTYSLRSTWQSTQAAKWPTTPAILTESKIVQHQDDDGSSYEVKVQYSYTVDGVVYEGSRVAFGYSASSGFKAHEEIHQKLKGAKAISVRYNPNDPSISCLSFGFHRSIQIGLAFAITWMLFIIGFTLLFWLFSRRDSVLIDNLTLE